MPMNFRNLRKEEENVMEDEVAGFLPATRLVLNNMKEEQQRSNSLSPWQNDSNYISDHHQHITLGSYLAREEYFRVVLLLLGYQVHL